MQSVFSAAPGAGEEGVDMDAASVWIVIALCFNVLILAVGALANNREKNALRTQAMKAEIKAELLEVIVGILLDKSKEEK